MSLSRQSLRVASLRSIPARPTSSVVILRALCAVVRARGTEPSRLLSALGVAPAVLADPDRRLPFATIARAWELSAELLGDEDFGLHLATAAPRGAFDLVEYVTRSCPTYGSALRHFGRYYPLLEDAAEVTLTVDGSQAQVEHRILDARWPCPRHGVEAMMAGWVLRARRAVGDRFKVRDAFFRYSAPASVSEHRRLFGRRLHFDAPASGMAFDARFLDAQLPTADDALHSVLKRQAESALAALPQDRTWSARAHKFVLQNVGDSQLSLSAVARGLAVSPRSLQRRLGEEGRTLQEIIAGVRRDLALGYLREGTRTSAEIGFLVGFSEAGAFQRAFRKWMGASPKQYRQSVALRSEPQLRPRRLIATSE